MHSNLKFGTYNKHVIQTYQIQTRYLFSFYSLQIQQTEDDESVSIEFWKEQHQISKCLKVNFAMHALNMQKTGSAKWTERVHSVLDLVLY